MRRLAEAWKTAIVLGCAALFVLVSAVIISLAILDLLPFQEVIPSLRKFLAVVAVAVVDATVRGPRESGAGRDRSGELITRRSIRRSGPLVRVNCAALSSGVLESELFGHEKGAFTGAMSRRPGRFELADGGTLFLDEVGDLPMEVQIKLLRVIQEQEFERVGGSRPSGGLQPGRSGRGAGEGGALVAPQRAPRPAWVAS